MRKSVSMGLVAGVLGMGLANAEIKVDDKLSLTGFIDMSVLGTMPDGGSSTLDAGLDQFELDFMYKFSDNLSAQIDLNHFQGAFYLEQGFVTYSTGPLAINMGRFLSSTGWEAAEPTGLYQYSYSKNCDGSIAAGCVYGGYQNGVSASFTISPMISLYGAVVGGIWDGTDTDISKPGIEVQLSLTPIEGLTIKPAFMYENETSDGTAQSAANVWASFETGPLTLAAEFNYLMDWGVTDETGMGYLAMVNYAINDKLGITVRYSAIDVENDYKGNEIAVSPGYAITDDWFVLAEIRQDIDDKVTSYAVESLITF